MTLWPMLFNLVQGRDGVGHGFLESFKWELDWIRKLGTDWGERWVRLGGQSFMCVCVALEIVIFSSVNLTLSHRSDEASL